MFPVKIRYFLMEYQSFLIKTFFFHFLVQFNYFFFITENKSNENLMENQKSVPLPLIYHCMKRLEVFKVEHFGYLFKVFSFFVYKWQNQIS